MLQKLKSRKFLLTLLTDIIAIATLFTNMGSQTMQIISIILIAVSNIVYAWIEGSIDAKSVVGVIKDASQQIENKLDN